MTNHKKLLVYAGTQDGREIALLLADNGIETDVCVATSYGEEMFVSHALIHIRTGRMNAEEMQQLMEENTYLAVIDATHPYATEVSKNIFMAAESVHLPYYRYSRDVEEITYEKNIHYVDSIQDAARLLNQMPGKILLTTGSKDLHTFAKLVEDKERLVVRVLPSIESISLCEQAGIGHKQMIAMHGPFSVAMNEAILMQYQIQILVTKETGTIGGYPAKLEAARKANIQTVVIRNPELQKQYNLQQLLEVLTSITGRKLQLQPTGELVVAGIGMGAEEGMTLAVRNALQQADIIFGAERMLQTVTGYRVPLLPLYQKEKILEYLKRHPEYRHPVVIMSGDVGFYSGSHAFYEENDRMRVTFLPGTSSISYFCAKVGIDWQDCHITSMHGRDANLIGKLCRYQKVFSLFSNLSEVKNVMQTMCRYHMEKYYIYLGSQLSYPEEQIRRLNPRQCHEISDLPEKGLYVVLFLKEEKVDMPIFPSIKDEEFIRGNVPMTKAGVRDLSLARMQLCENAVVWDIGAGTGSVSVCCALASDTIHVYAVEQKEEAVALIQQNKEHFAADAISIIHKKAPEGLEKLPTPTHVFIGGSGGNLSEIMRLVWIKNPRARVVINAITLETIAEAIQILSDYAHTDEEIMQVSVSQASKAGAYHLMQAQNPVSIISFTLAGESEE